MKKRLFAIITAIAMVFAMLPNMPDEVHADTFDVKFIAVDKRTGNPLKWANIELREGGSSYAAFDITSKDGTVRALDLNGSYTITATPPTVAQLGEDAPEYQTDGTNVYTKHDGAEVLGFMSEDGYLTVDGDDKYIEVDDENKIVTIKFDSIEYICYPLVDTTITYGDSTNLYETVLPKATEGSYSVTINGESNTTDTKPYIYGSPKGISFTCTSDDNSYAIANNSTCTVPFGSYTLEAVNNDSPEKVFKPATITINKKVLSAEDISIKANDKTYNGDNAADLTATISQSAIVGTDDVSLLISGEFDSPEPGDNIGINYTITLTGSAAENYTLADGLETGTAIANIICDHDYSAEWETNDESHWHKCTTQGCNEKKDEGSHTPGTAATCDEPQKCTECGYELAKETGHTYDTNTWKSDSNQHWRECTNNCGTRDGEAAHAFTLEKANNDTLKSAATCTAAAVYYKSCECGTISKTETFTSEGTADHTPGDAATCTTPQTCINCTYEFAPATGHKYDTAWKSDSNQHWHECTNNCGTKSGEAAHAFTLEKANNDTLKSAATCTAAAVYYKSCECGVISKTETFTFGEPAGHTGGKATCTDKARCTICKAYYGDALGHDWNAWEKLDGTKHIRTCKRADCGHAEIEAHSPDLKCGANAQSCTVCGATAASEHKFDTKTWKTDSHKHWHECTACGERKDESAHDYNKKVDGDVPQTCPTCKYGGHITRVTPGGFDDGDIPESLSIVYDSVAKIQNAMTGKISEMKFKSEGNQLYDAMLEYSVDGGDTWYKASEHYFPEDGRLSVKMEVPEGTSLDKHNYTVLHMFSSNAFGKTAGDIETPTVLEEKGADGKQYISFYVTGLSPIMVAWEEAPNLNSSKDETPDDTKDEKKYPIDEDGDGEVDFYLSEDEFNADDYVAVDEDGDGTTDYYVPKDVWDEDDNVGSGDDSNILPWILVMMTALTAATITIVGRRYRRN